MKKGLAWTGGALAAAMLASAPALAVELLPHRAMYRMVLGHNDGDSALQAALGAMEYRFEDACDGWAVSNRTELKFLYEDEEVESTSWSFSSWESRDGAAYRYRVNHNIGRAPADKIAGRATLASGDGAGGGEAAFSLPKDAVVALPDGAMFPTRHLIALLESALAGELIYWRVVFDGASMDNPYEINAVIHEEGAASRKAAAEATGLAEQRVWRMRLSFHPVAKPDAKPEFELSVRYREDGVADELEQDYGDFSIKLKAASIEPLANPGCRRN